MAIPRGPNDKDEGISDLSRELGLTALMSAFPQLIGAINDLKNTIDAKTDTDNHHSKHNTSRGGYGGQKVSAGLERIDMRIMETNSILDSVDGKLISQLDQNDKIIEKLDYIGNNLNPEMNSNRHNNGGIAKVNNTSLATANIGSESDSTNEDFAVASSESSAGGSFNAIIAERLHNIQGTLHHTMDIQAELLETVKKMQGSGGGFGGGDGGAPRPAPSNDEGGGGFLGGIFGALGLRSLGRALIAGGSSVLGMGEAALAGAGEAGLVGGAGLGIAGAAGLGLAGVAAGVAMHSTQKDDYSLPHVLGMDKTPVDKIDDQIAKQQQTLDSVKQEHAGAFGNQKLIKRLTDEEIEIQGKINKLQEEKAALLQAEIEKQSNKVVGDAPSGQMELGPASPTEVKPLNVTPNSSILGDNGGPIQGSTGGGGSSVGSDRAGDGRSRHVMTGDEHGYVGANDPNTHHGAGTTSQKETANQVYQAFKKAGMSEQWAKIMTGEVGRENSMNPQFLYGTHTDAANHVTNTGMFSWQGERGDELRKFMAEKGLLTSDGKIKPGQESLDAMAEFAKHEIDSKPEYRATKDAMASNPKPSYGQGADLVGRNYVRWRMDDPQYRESGLNRRAQFAGMVGPDAIGQNADGAGNDPNHSKGDISALAQRIQQISPNLSTHECVELALKTAGIPYDNDVIKSLRRGEPSVGGSHKLLPVGTPVSTFFNSDFSIGDRYAAGGTGVGGIGRDHMGTIAGYEDKNHKPTDNPDAVKDDGYVTMYDQWGGKNPKGPGITAYKYNDPRGGEHAGSNFFSINDDKGRPAGTYNPLANETIDDKSKVESKDKSNKLPYKQPEDKDDDYMSIVDKDYTKRKEYPAKFFQERDLGINAHVHDMIYKNSIKPVEKPPTNNIIKHSSESPLNPQTTNPLVQQFNVSSAAASKSLTNAGPDGKTKTQIGMVAPPDNRIKQLFVDTREKWNV